MNKKHHFCIEFFRFYSKNGTFSFMSESSPKPRSDVLFCLFQLNGV